MSKPSNLPTASSAMPLPPPPGATAAELVAALATLQRAVKNRACLLQLTQEERTELLSAAGDLYCPDLRERRRLVKAQVRQRKAEKIERDQSVLNQTGIRQLRQKKVYTSPNVFPPENPALVDPSPAPPPPPPDVLEPQNCYICKHDYSSLHHFYDQLCPACAEFNFRKRSERADLRGRVALVTGGRVKIGYQASLKLLRCGAHVIVTTRFPQDSARRYTAEADFTDWSHRLEIYGLELRHTRSVEAFCQHLLATQARLDFIINNACQTVRRPPEFYQHMMALEIGALPHLSEPMRRLLPAHEPWVPDPASDSSQAALMPAAPAPIPGRRSAAEYSQVPLLPEDQAHAPGVFPAGALDQDLQQVDLRDRNSWRLNLDEVPTVELMEVHLVNAVAPFIFNARLKPLLLRSPNRDKHIVNVSAVEGQFYRKFKTTRHPHTNMAKASLNMMTRTSAADYHADGIHMNSVDTGWVTDEDPVAIAQRKRQQHRFHPPLDIVDGAARILDPIIHGINTGEHLWGKFLKDYVVTDW